MKQNKNSGNKSLESLTNKNWKSFQLIDLFNIYTGKDITIANLKQGSIPVISHSMHNNGVAFFSSYIEHRKLFDHTKCISLADRGNFWATIQPVDFYVATRVKVLEIKEDYLDSISKEVLLFISTMINKQSVRFNYGNNATAKTGRILIMLPTRSDQTPDWEYMRRYILEMKKEILPSEKFIEYRIYDNRGLDEIEWKGFRIEDIFSIERGTRLVKSEQKQGRVPYVSSSGANNGIDNFISPPEKMKIHKECLTLANSGTVGTAFFHPYSFVASDHITVLKNVNLNKHTSCFIIPSLNKLKSKYSFNREINNKRLKRETIILPINKEGHPDWIFMEQYIKRMENKLNEEMSILF